MKNKKTECEYNQKCYRHYCPGIESCELYECFREADKILDKEIRGGYRKRKGRIERWRENTRKLIETSELAEKCQR